MDTRLALGIKPIDIPDQAQSLQRAMTLQALQGQSTLQGLQIDEGRRTLRQNQAMDEAASGSTSTADYLTRLAKINPGAAAKLEHELLGTQKTRGEVEEQQSKLAQGLTAGFMSVPDAQKPQAYAQFAAEWKRQGLPNADKVPDQFDPAMIPHLTMIAHRGLTSEQAATRADEAGLVPQGPPASPTVAALATPAPVGAGTQAYNDRFTPEQTTVGTANPAVAALPPNPAPNPVPNQTQAAPDSRELSAADYRNEATRLRGKGTKVANEQAKEFMAEADRIEGRSLEKQKMEQDKYTPVAGAPGVSFNKKTGIYDLNGKPISADEVQRIANQQAKSGASVITQNAGPKAFYGDYGKNMADQLSAEQKSAQKAADTVSTINKMRAEVDSGIYTGGFAERKLGVINMLNGLGIHVDEKKLANTQAFKSFVGSQLLQHAKDLGTNPSNADAVRIDKIIGNIENDPNALVKIMDFNEEMGRRAVDRFNAHYQEVRKDPNAQFGFDMTVHQPEKYKSRDVQVRSNQSAVPQKGGTPPLTNAKGWTLHLDAQGRQAYVSPDGTQFEEVR